MDKLYLVLLSLLSSFNIEAQNIEIYQGNSTTDISGTCISVFDSNAMPPSSIYSLTLKIKNTDTVSKNLKITRLKLMTAVGENESIIWSLDGDIGTTYAGSDVSPFDPWTTPQSINFSSMEEGSYYIYLTANSGTAKYRYYVQEYFQASDSLVALDSVDVKFESSLSINIETETTVSTFPNPANNFVTVNIANITSATSISLYDISGKIAIETILSNGNNLLNISALKSGLYIYTIKNKDGVIETKKLLVQ